MLLDLTCGNFKFLGFQFYFKLSPFSCIPYAGSRFIFSIFLSHNSNFCIWKEWKQVHMNDFVKMTNGFMQELESPESKPRVQTYEAFYNEENDKPLQP